MKKIIPYTLFESDDDASRFDRHASGMDIINRSKISPAKRGELNDVTQTLYDILIDVTDIGYTTDVHLTPLKLALIERGADIEPDIYVKILYDPMEGKNDLHKLVSSKKELYACVRRMIDYMESIGWKANIIIERVTRVEIRFEKPSNNLKDEYFKTDELF